MAGTKKKTTTQPNIPLPSQQQQALHHNATLFGALSYLWILSVLFLLFFRGNEFVQFHAKQGFVLWLISIACWFVPVLGWLANLAIMVLILIGFLEALEGKQWKIPYIGTLADRIHL